MGLVALKERAGTEACRNTQAAGNFKKLLGGDCVPIDVKRAHRSTLHSQTV
jgi:hypothetical protein